MKKIYLAFLLIFITGFNLLAQSLTDQASIIQKCIDLPEIQQLYPLNKEGKPVVVHIMQYPIEIPINIEVNKFGKKPVFMSRHEIYDNNVEAFFLFKSIDILESTAYLTSTFYYNYNSSDQKVLSIDLSFIKDNGSWKISDSKLTQLK